MAEAGVRRAIFPQLQVFLITIYKPPESNAFGGYSLYHKAL